MGERGAIPEIREGSTLPSTAARRRVDVKNFNSLPRIVRLAAGGER